MSFQKVDPRLFTSRGDPDDLRLGDLVRNVESQNAADSFPSSIPGSTAPTETKRSYILAGYPDDEGIRINNGRLGAALGPDAVRRHLLKMTPPLFGSPSPFELFDLGNLHVSEYAIDSRHEQVTAFALQAQKSGYQWISVGGGHDYGFADADAYIQWAKAKGERPLILNFDAHLDVRPVEGGISSGTPFYRMLEKHPDVDFAEIGIQGHCNSRKHFDWAVAKGARVLTQEEILASGESFTENVMRLLGDWLLKRRSVFLSVDIDGFSSAYAPGCSQSWATGFSALDFFSTLQILRGRLSIQALGIYEVSPPLDHDDRTAKLAAQIIHRVLS